MSCGQFGSQTLTNFLTNANVLEDLRTIQVVLSNQCGGSSYKCDSLALSCSGLDSVVLNLEGLVLVIFVRFAQTGLLTRLSTKEELEKTIRLDDWFAVPAFRNFLIRAPEQCDLLELDTQATLWDESAALFDNLKAVVQDSLGRVGREGQTKVEYEML